MYRDRGDYAAARDAISRRARQAGPIWHTEWRFVGASRRWLARRRPVAAFVPAVGDDPGLHVSTEGVSDNLGVHYVASTIGGAAALGDATSLGFAVMHQYLGEHSPVRSSISTPTGSRRRYRVRSNTVRSSAESDSLAAPFARRRRAFDSGGRRGGCGLAQRVGVGARGVRRPRVSLAVDDDVVTGIGWRERRRIERACHQRDDRRPDRRGGHRAHGAAIALERRQRARDDAERTHATRWRLRCGSCTWGIESPSPNAAPDTGIRSTMSRTRWGSRSPCANRTRTLMGGARAARYGAEQGVASTHDRQRPTDTPSDRSDQPIGVSGRRRAGELTWRDPGWEGTQRRATGSGASASTDGLVSPSAFAFFRERSRGRRQSRSADRRHVRPDVPGRADRPIHPVCSGSGFSITSRIAVWRTPRRRSRRSPSSCRSTMRKR